MNTEVLIGCAVVLIPLGFFLWPENPLDAKLRPKYLLFLNSCSWHEEAELLEIMQRFHPELTHNQHHRILSALLDHGLVERKTIQPGESFNGTVFTVLVATYYKLRDADEDAGKRIFLPLPVSA